MDLDRPIFIIGAARSGTTMLADILGRHPDVCYWVEPKYVWRYARPWARDDVRARSEATDSVSDYIRRKFAARLARSGRSRFAEKTPSNCFRVPFIHEIFPNGKFVHVLRNGWDVALSASRKWTTKPERKALLRRATSFEIPMRDMPYYAGDFMRDVVARQFNPGKAYIWGPHFPGVREVRARHTVLETCALQWRASVEAALEGLAEIPAAQVHTVRFEDFVSRPVPSLSELLSFLELPPSEQLLAFADSSVQREASERWRAAAAEELKPIEPLIRSTLNHLGYSSEHDGPDSPIPNMKVTR